MSDYLHTLDLDETHRVVVYSDNDSYHDKPWDWNDEVGICHLHSYRNEYSDTLTSRSTHTSAIRTIVDAEYRADIDIEEAVKTHFARAGMSAKFATLRGYSQSEWADVVVYSTDETYLDAFLDTVQKWFRGDVYIYALQERVVYTAPDGRTIEAWDTLESVCGNYDDNDEQSLRDFANDYLPSLPV